jgi:hypothetical protein
MTDFPLLAVIKDIPQQAQRQYGTDEQLRYLMEVANKLGLYDAADRLRNMEEGPSAFMSGVNLLMRSRRGV